MIIARLSLLLAIPALAAGPAVSAAHHPTSRYSKLSGCKVVEQGAEDEDWIIHQCDGFGDIPVWIAYSDGNKAYVGFGRTRNVTGWFGIDRNEKWPIEWRGWSRGSEFHPFAVIIRMPELPAGARSDLIVYRLRPDGASCIIGTERIRNDAARRIADASASKFTCAQQPQVIK